VDEDQDRQQVAWDDHGQGSLLGHLDPAGANRWSESSVDYLDPFDEGH
jgi:hypothetical protein